MAKVKVLGKGDAGLAQLEKYIPQVFCSQVCPQIFGSTWYLGHSVRRRMAHHSKHRLLVGNSKTN